MTSLLQTATSHEAMRPARLEDFPERALLLADGQAWGGLTLGYFEAADHDAREHVWLPHPCVGVLTSGRARAVIRSGAELTEIDISAGVAGVFGPELEVSRSTWKCRDARRIFIELEESSYQRLGLADELLQVPLQQNLAAPDPHLFGVMTAMVQELEIGCPHGKLYSESLAQGLLRHVHRRYARAEGKVERGKVGLTRAQFQRVREYVLFHLASDISLEQLAGLAGVSRAHFVRLFRNATDRSPHTFVIDQRLRRARYLLQHSQLPLTQLALVCGFSSQSHLTSLFRREMGTTPGAFRDVVGARCS